MPADGAAVINPALQDIQRYLADHGQSLADFPPMPLPADDAPMHQQPQVIREERCYDQAGLQRFIEDSLQSLNEAQRHVYDAVTGAMAAPGQEVCCTTCHTSCMHMPHHRQTLPSCIQASQSSL